VLLNTIGVVFLAVVIPEPVRGAPQHAPDALNDEAPLPVISGSSAESRIEPRFSRVATLLSGRRAEVRCWSLGDWDKRMAERRALWGQDEDLGTWGAYTSSDWRARIQLAPAVCAELGRLAYQDVSALEDEGGESLAWAVAVLAHESEHVRGIDDEAAAECYGMQSIRAAARALGATRREAAFLAVLYWYRWYPGLDDPDYRSPECRDGGRLDLRRRSTIWP
jgi:hypothetical protein